MSDASKVGIWLNGKYQLIADDLYKSLTEQYPLQDFTGKYAEQSLVRTPAYPDPADKALQARFDANEKYREASKKAEDEQRAFGTSLPVGRTERKHLPMATGLLDYFPKALAYVARVSYDATQQHHPGEPMHWDRNKSSDHADCLVRHIVERGTIDTDKIRHSGKAAWRALALLEVELELAAAKGEEA